MINKVYPILSYPMVLHDYVFWVTDQKKAVLKDTMSENVHVYYDYIALLSFYRQCSNVLNVKQS